MHSRQTPWVCYRWIRTRPWVEPLLKWHYGYNFMWTWGYQDYSSRDIHSQAFQHHVEVFYLFLNSHSMFLRCEVRLITAPNLNDHYENWMRLYKMTSSGSLTYKQGFLLLFNTFYYHLNMLKSLWGWLFPFQVLPPTLSVS